MLISYKWLKSYIKDIPSEDEIAKVITFSICELEGIEKKDNGDTIFDLKVLPDRAHDLLSHRGVAFEIAGLLGLSFQDVKYNLPENFIKTKLEIKIETENCYRYMGRIVRGVKVGPSPVWMKDYLESIGQRSINNIVDATNIVLFDTGQPIHTFDLDKLNSEKIVVSNAKEGETLLLVGSEKLEAKLKSTDMMITDGVKNIAIAGVKGGLDSGISDGTENILIEVATFDAVSVRKTARRLSILSDASKRYENGISPIVCTDAMDEITALIYEMCKDATFEEVVDVYKKIDEERILSFSSDYISKVLGTSISNEIIEKILHNYHYKFSRDNNIFTINVPYKRLDIVGPHDMAEEIGRVYGYENIAPILPEAEKEMKDNDTWIKINLAKQKLVSDGYKEVMNYALTNTGDVEIMASASDKNFLRTNLTDGIKKSYELNKLNSPLLDIKDLKIFEVGAIFKKDTEEICVCMADKKGITEMSLDEFIKNNNLSLTDDSYLQILNFKPVGKFTPWSIYPFISRDIAVWVPNGVESSQVYEVIKENAGELLIKEPYLFDKFTKPASAQGGESRTSYAYRLVFQSYDKTLTDAEINPIMEKINTKIASLGWEVR